MNGRLLLKVLAAANIWAGLCIRAEVHNDTMPYEGAMPKIKEPLMTEALERAEQLLLAAGIPADAEL